MYLTGITHRQQLFDLMTRWFADRPDPQDGVHLTQVFTYENLITTGIVRDFLTDIKQTLCPGPLRVIHLRSKDQLRDAIARSCTNPAPREAELVNLYRREPEEFYPGTPLDAFLSLRADGSILGIARYKRLRRIAEKAARKASDKLAREILNHVRLLSAGQVTAGHTSIGELLDTRAEFGSHFDQAERIIAQRFRNGGSLFSADDLRVEDAVGFKFVGTPEELRAIEEGIRNHSEVVGIRRTEHHGVYSDTKLLVDLQLPRPDRIITNCADRNWSRLATRGLTADELEAGFPDYVLSGERTFCAEVILTTRPALVESEFGSAIHERRMIEQRQELLYAGRLASNASYLLSYMLALALSPSTNVDELPVKMWGRYVPDALFESIWKLFGITLGREGTESLLPLRVPSMSTW